MYYKLPFACFLVSLSRSLAGSKQTCISNELGLEKRRFPSKIVTFHIISYTLLLLLSSWPPGGSVNHFSCFVDSNKHLM